MSRISVLARQPKRTVAGLATALAAVGLAAGSGADFTSSSSNPANTFSSGTLSQTNDKANAAILSLSGMKPGSTTNGSVTITNTGTLPGAFTLSKSNLVDSKTGTGGVKLSGQLDLKVADVTGAPATPPVVYDGKVGAMGSIALDYDPATVGTQQFPANGGARTYSFTVTLPSTTGDDYQGTEMTVQYDWTATS